MLIMESISKIRRLYHVQGKGFKTIARELKVSKNTVKRIIREDITAPEYKKRSDHYRCLESYRSRLLERLIADEGEPVRRRRSSRKLYLEVQGEGYAGSYDAVHAFVMNWRRQNHSGLTRAFVPLSFDAGESFQFDWSEEEIELCGVLTRIILNCSGKYDLKALFFQYNPTIF